MGEAAGAGGMEEAEWAAASSWWERIHSVASTAEALPVAARAWVESSSEKPILRRCSIRMLSPRRSSPAKGVAAAQKFALVREERDIYVSIRMYLARERERERDERNRDSARRRKGKADKVFELGKSILSV